MVARATQIEPAPAQPPTPPLAPKPACETARLTNIECNQRRVSFDESIRRLVVTVTLEALTMMFVRNATKTVGSSSALDEWQRKN